MARPRLHDDALRGRLLEVASEVVADAGPAALTVRDVAARAGTSASAVYALFGGREELVHAVGREAFRRFETHLASAPHTDDPEADLLALGLAYRASALADPHFYRVMFDTAGTGAREASAPPATTEPTFRLLADAVVRVLVAHGVPAEAAGPASQGAALALWGLAHGLVELELAGLLPGTTDVRADRYAGALRAVGATALARPVEPAPPAAGG
jgi:AcrR family transcriptional regulator